MFLLFMFFTIFFFFIYHILFTESRPTNSLIDLRNLIYFSNRCKRIAAVIVTCINLPPITLTYYCNTYARVFLYAITIFLLMYSYTAIAKISEFVSPKINTLVRPFVIVRTQKDKKQKKKRIRATNATNAKRRERG